MEPSLHTTNIVSLFDFKSHRIRVTLIDGEPWFVAADVCRVLEMDVRKGTSKWVMQLDDDEKFIATRVDFPRLFWGRSGSTLTLISESGLYALILRSNKPEAIEFQRWVRKEVLPAIRKTGGYMLKGADRNAIAEGTISQEDLAALLEKAAVHIRENIKLKAEITELRPKAEVADRIAGTQGSFSLREVAKLSRCWKQSGKQSDERSGHLPRCRYGAISASTRRKPPREPSHR